MHSFFFSLFFINFLFSFRLHSRYSTYWRQSFLKHFHGVSDYWLLAPLVLFSISVSSRAILFIFALVLLSISFFQLRPLIVSRAFDILGLSFQWFYHSFSFLVQVAFSPTLVSAHATIRFCFWYRGYYMTSRRYEISLRVLKNISRVIAAKRVKYFLTLEEKCRISKRPCNILFIT